MRIIRIYKLSILLVSSLILCCCNDDAETVNGDGAENGELAALTVKTDISPVFRSTKSGTVSSFTDDSQLGLFITQSGSIDHIFERYGTGRNICSIYKSGNWHQQTGDMLDNTPVRVFAYYPFQPGNYYPRQIPIEHTSQTDYMYGTHAIGSPEVNKHFPEVRLAMKHALSLIEFNITGSDFAVDMVNNIVITNTGHNINTLHSRGTLDISTGEITYDGTSNDPARWENDGSLFVGDGQPIRMLVMPLSQTTLTGTVTVYFEIDNEAYAWQVPAGTSWQSGMKNTYHMQGVGRELRVQVVLIEPWGQGVNETYPLE